MLVKFYLAAILLTVFILGVGVGSADAAKAQGNYMSEINSKKVCGDRLCSEAKETESMPVMKDTEDKKEETGKVVTGEAMIKEEQEEGQQDISPFTPPPPVFGQITDDVYHYFGGFYNSLVVITSEGVLITDPANPARAEMLKQEIANITDLPVTKIILTHEHYDHVGGTDVFADAEIVCHSICQEVFDLEPLGIAPETVDTTYDEFLSIDFGGKTIELHHFGPSDGDASTVIYLPEENIIATADLYMSNEFTNGNFIGDMNYLGLRNVFHEIRDWDIDHAVNSHTLSTDTADLYANIEFVDELYDAVFAELSQAYEQDGQFAMFASAEALPEKIKLEKYKDWGNYDHLPIHIQRMAASLYHGD